MSRTPYSPFVLKETAPEPWKAGRVLRVTFLGSRTDGPVAAHRMRRVYPT